MNRTILITGAGTGFGQGDMPATGRTPGGKDRFHVFLRRVDGRPVYRVLFGIETRSRGHYEGHIQGTAGIWRGGDHDQFRSVPDRVQ